MEATNIYCEVYGQRIKNTTQLSRKEEIELAKKIKEGDHKSLDKLVGANLRFVISVANSYKNSGIDVEELVGYGNMGLVKAAKRFDTNSGTKFISYAVWWIRQAIMAGMPECSRSYRAPLNAIAHVALVSKYINTCLEKSNQRPTNDDIMVGTGLSSENVEMSIRVINDKNSPSIDYQNYNSEYVGHFVDSTLYRNNISTSSCVSGKIFTEECGELLKNKIDKLDARTKNCITLYYGLGTGIRVSLVDIANKQNPIVTKERIRQIIRKGLKRLGKSKVLKELHNP